MPAPNPCLPLLTQATVMRVMDFGAFAAFDVEVSTGGRTQVQEVVGLIHRTEMSWAEVGNAVDIVKVSWIRTTALKNHWQERKQECAL